MNIIDVTYKFRPGGVWPKRSVNLIQRLVVHHSAVPYDNQSDEARMRAEMQGHLNRGWPGLSYHFFIGQSGNIYKLNNFDDATYTDSENVHALTVCLDGYFHPPINNQPNNAQLQSLKDLLTDLSKNHPEFPAGQKNVMGHREVSRLYQRYEWATSCPGDNLFSKVVEYRDTGNINLPNSSPQNMSIAIGQDVALNYINNLNQVRPDLPPELLDTYRYWVQREDWGQIMMNVSGLHAEIYDLKKQVSEMQVRLAEVELKIANLPTQANTQTPQQVQATKVSEFQPETGQVPTN